MRRDRDSIVAEGIEAHRKSLRSQQQKGPWLYRAKVKAGNRPTRSIEDTFTSIPHLMGQMVFDHAQENETFSVYGVTRIMKGQLQSQREDI